jgi:hypothetical protein
MMVQRFGVIAHPLPIPQQHIGTLMETIAPICTTTASINHNFGMVNEETVLGLVRSANAGPGTVQSTEEPATQIQEELVIWMLICSRS